MRFIAQVGWPFITQVTTSWMTYVINWTVLIRKKKWGASLPLLHTHSISEWTIAKRFDLAQVTLQATKFLIKFTNFMQRIAISNLALTAGFNKYPHVKQNIIGHWGEVVPGREFWRREFSRPGTTSPQWPIMFCLTWGCVSKPANNAKFAIAIRCIKFANFMWNLVTWWDSWSRSKRVALAYSLIVCLYNKGKVFRSFLSD